MFKNSWKLLVSLSNKNKCACKSFLTKEVSVCVFLHLINIHAQEQGRMTFFKLKILSLRIVCCLYSSTN